MFDLIYMSLFFFYFYFFFIFSLFVKVIHDKGTYDAILLNKEAGPDEYYNGIIIYYIYLYYYYYI